MIPPPHPVHPAIFSHPVQTIAALWSGPDFQDFRTDRIWKDWGKEDWVTEFEQGYAAASRHADSLGLPLYFMGYSLGALIAEYAMMTSRGKIRFEKQLLLAPAIAFRNRTHLIKATTSS